MTMTAFTATATATTPATVVRIVPDKSGIQWVIGQLGAESFPFRGSASVKVFFNGRYVTSSSVLPSSAGGQPFITLQSKDIVTVEFSGLSVGDQGIVTMFYTETLWGITPTADVM